MATISKKEIVDRIVTEQQIKRKLVKNVVQNFLDEMTTELASGNRLEFRNFGIFESKKKPARVGLNPRNLDPVEIPAKRIVKFKMGRLMKQKLSADKCNACDTMHV